MPSNNSTEIYSEFYIIYSVNYLGSFGSMLYLLIFRHIPVNFGRNSFVMLGDELRIKYKENYFSKSIHVVARLSCFRTFLNPTLFKNLLLKSIISQLIVSSISLSPWITVHIPLTETPVKFLFISFSSKR